MTREEAEALVKAFRQYKESTAERLELPPQPFLIGTYEHLLIELLSDDDINLAAHLRYVVRHMAPKLEVA